jgi:DNA-binding CsgD family transcriptional regulator
VAIWRGRPETRGDVVGQPLTHPANGPNGPAKLALALASLAELEFQLGDWGAAYASAVESLRLANASGEAQDTHRGLARLALVEAGLGREQACRRHGQQALALADRHADHSCRVLARSALGLLELGLGRLDAAVAWLEPLTDAPSDTPGTWICDLVEALIRRGDNQRAAGLVAAPGRDAAQPRDLTTRRALERCRGLLAPEYDFDAHFVRALDYSAHPEEPFERARTELCFGQRLRRTGQRIAARQRLCCALETFERLGAEPWAAIAKRELSASGERARRRLDETRDELTAQERQVAHIVAEGATNREAATRLFVTTKTIETHLSRIYRKLGLRSRTDLARMYAAEGVAQSAAQADPSTAPRLARVASPTAPLSRIRDFPDANGAHRRAS